MAVLQSKGVLKRIRVNPSPCCRPIVSNDDYKVRNPAIVHDYLYSKKGEFVQNTPKLAESFLKPQRL